MKYGVPSIRTQCTNNEYSLTNGPVIFKLPEGPHEVTIGTIYHVKTTVNS